MGSNKRPKLNGELRRNLLAGLFGHYLLPGGFINLEHFLNGSFSFGKGHWLLCVHSLISTASFNYEYAGAQCNMDRQ